VWPLPKPSLGGILERSEDITEFIAVFKSNVLILLVVVDSFLDPRVREPIKICLKK
jgi:hypothetical protein